MQNKLREFNPGSIAARLYNKMICKQFLRWCNQFYLDIRYSQENVTAKPNTTDLINLKFSQENSIWMEYHSTFNCIANKLRSTTLFLQVISLSLRNPQIFSLLYGCLGVFSVSMDLLNRSSAALDYEMYSTERCHYYSFRIVQCLLLLYWRYL